MPCRRDPPEQPRGSEELPAATGHGSDGTLTIRTVPVSASISVRGLLAQEVLALKRRFLASAPDQSSQAADSQQGQRHRLGDRSLHDRHIIDPDLRHQTCARVAGQQQ